MGAALGLGAWLTPRNVSPHLGYHVEFGRSRSNGTKIRQKLGIVYRFSSGHLWLLISDLQQ